MDAIDRLVAIEDIKRTKAKYFRCMDTKDWDGFATVFADDAVMDMSSEMRDGSTEGDGITRGAKAIAAFVRGAVDPVVTVHHGHMPEIDFTSDTTADVIWAMEDKLWWPEGSPLTAMHGYGHYHEQYVRTADGWRIANTRLTRLRVDAR